MSLLRASSSTLRHASTALRSRTLATSVLLTKDWEQKSVNELRKEAKSRGLNPTGGKASLVKRIQDSEKRPTPEAVSSAPAASRRPTPAAPAPASTPAPAQQQVRNVSVLTHKLPTPEAAAPAPGSVSPGIPPDAQPSYDKEYLNVKLPDLSGPDVYADTQIPAAFDLWHSKGAASHEPKLTAPPKLHVLGDAAATVSTAAAAVHEKIDTLAHDAMAALPGGSSSSSSSGGRSGGPGELSAEERTGAWTLGGILLGSWLLGGFFDAGSSIKEQAHAAAEEAHHKADDLKEKGQRAVDDAKGKASDLKAKAGEQAETLKSKASDVGAAVSQKVDDAKAKASDLKAKAGEQVQALKGKASDAAASAGQKADDVKAKVVGK